MARSKGIQFQFKKWKSSLSQIRAVLFDAAQKEITDEAAKLWLDRLQDLAYDIDDELDDLATKAMHTKESGASTSKVTKLMPTCCTSFSLSTRMKDKINDISTRLQDLAEEKNTLGLNVKVGKSKNMNRRLETSLVDALFPKLLGDETCNQNFSIIPMVGVGGIGKTTLARLLYNEARVKDHFELKAWVCVFDEFDIFKITKIIFQSVHGGDQEFADLNLLQVTFGETISYSFWMMCGVKAMRIGCKIILTRPFLAGAPGSKIILTTQKLQLLTQVGYDQPYRLQILSHGNALSLFAQQASGENNFNSHPTLKSYGEGIVKRCDGLPLALIALGRLLRTKANEEDWKELNSEIWKLQKGNEIIPALFPAHLKQLFAYCSLFPKDYVFDKEELVLL